MASLLACNRRKQEKEVVGNWRVVDHAPGRPEFKAKIKIYSLVFGGTQSHNEMVTMGFDLQPGVLAAQPAELYQPHKENKTV
eukprot:972289-Pelagomonas_calceolata.AAC.1